MIYVLIIVSYVSSNSGYKLDMHDFYDKEACLVAGVTAAALSRQLTGANPPVYACVPRRTPTETK